MYQSVLSFVIVAEMKLSFQLATIALGLCVTAAGFMYFFCDTNLVTVALGRIAQKSEHLTTTVSKETEEEDEG